MKLRLANPDDVPRLLAIARAAEHAAQWSEEQWRVIFGSQNPGSQNPGSQDPGPQSLPRLVWLCEGPAGDAGSPAAGGPEGSGAVAFLVAQCAGADWELENLAVLPEFRRRGAALALLSALLGEAPQGGAERVLLEVRASNLGAIRLYERAGFRQLARRRGYYAHPPEDALIYGHSF